MPLKAKLDGEDFFAWDLEEANRKDKFGCPHCDDRLIPVMPEENIINHFRHKNGEAHGEPETPEHIAGKQLLYNWLIQRGVEAVPEIKVGWHICDMWSKHQGTITLFEFQCSSISVKEMLDRAKSYDCFHFWIWGGKYLKNARTFRPWKGGQYNIQRISKAEARISEWNPLLYIDTNTSTLLYSDWKPRARSKFLGWYNLYVASPSILPRLEIL